MSDITFFNDHYRSSNDKFRFVTGYVWDSTAKTLTHLSQPSNPLSINPSWDFKEPILVNVDKLLFKQRVTYSPWDGPDQEVLQQTDVSIFGLPEGQKVKDYLVNWPITSSKANYEDFVFSLYIPDKIRSTEEYYRISSEYNYYIKRLEELMAYPHFPEEVLPNLYVFSLKLKGDPAYNIVSGDYDSTILNGDRSAYTPLTAGRKFDQLISLNGNISLGLGAPGASAEGTDFWNVALYMNNYAQVFDSVELDFIDTFIKKFQHVLTDVDLSDEFRRIYGYRNLFPMYVDIEFTTEQYSPFLEKLRKFYLTSQMFQDFVISKIEPENQLVQENVILKTFDRDSDKTNDQVIVDCYNFTDWYDKYVGESVTFEEEDDEQPSNPSSIQQLPINFTNLDFQNVVEIQNDYVEILQPESVQEITNLKIENFRSFEEIIKGKKANKDILGFKIEKRDANDNLIQTFYFPNISGEKIINFVDTQVKYDYTYKYKVFAWVLVYGTQYYYSPVEFNRERIVERVKDRIRAIVDRTPILFPDKTSTHSKNIEVKDGALTQDQTTIDLPPFLQNNES